MSYYLMHRGWMEKRIFEREPFDRRSAWVWLIENAAWEPTRVRIDAQPIDLALGELSFSENFLAAKWRWSRSAVHRYLTELTTWGMISLRNSPTRKANSLADRGQRIITICNYAKYQDLELIYEQRSEQTLNRLRTDSEHKNKPLRQEDRKEGRINGSDSETHQPESESPKTAQAPSRYAYAGKVVRLTPTDYDRWHKRYHGIADLEAYLGTLDDFYATLPADEQKKWFVRCSAALEKKHEAEMQRRVPMTVNDPLPGI